MHSYVVIQMFQDAPRIVEDLRRAGVRPPLRLRDLLQRRRDGSALLAERLVPLQAKSPTLIQ